MKKLTTQDVAELALVDKVDYNEITGEFTSKETGKKIGGIDKTTGYYQIFSIGKKVYGHRLAFLIKGEDITGKYIDHIDQNKSNNIFSNLRIVEENENHRNMPLPINNKTGTIGVSKEYKKKNGERYWTGKYCAKITVDYKGISLGSYDNIEDAISARKVAEKYYGFHKNHGK